MNSFGLLRVIEVGKVYKTVAYSTDLLTADFIQAFKNKKVVIDISNKEPQVLRIFEEEWE